MTQEEGGDSQTAKWAAEIPSKKMGPIFVVLLMLSIGRVASVTVGEDAPPSFYVGACRRAASLAVLSEVGSRVFDMLPSGRPLFSRALSKQGSSAELTRSSESVRGRSFRARQSCSCSLALRVYALCRHCGEYSCIPVPVPVGTTLSHSDHARRTCADKSAITAHVRLLAATASAAPRASSATAPPLAEHDRLEAGHLLRLQRRQP